MFTGRGSPVVRGEAQVFYIRFVIWTGVGLLAALLIGD